MLIYPTYAILMAERGVGPTALALLFVLWSGSAILFEVPSGVIGDLYSRTRVVAAGSAIKGAAFGVWWLWPSLPGFALGFVGWSLGESLRSGTSEALLHDALADRGEAEDFEEVLGRGLAASGIGVVLALAMGGALAESGYGLPLGAEAFGWSAAFLAVGAVSLVAALGFAARE